MVRGNRGHSRCAIVTFRLALVISALSLGATTQVRADPISGIEDSWDWFMDALGLGGSSSSGSPATVPDGTTPAPDSTSSAPGSNPGLIPEGIVPIEGGMGDVGGGGIEGDVVTLVAPPQGPAIPEPATLLLASMGVAGLVALRRGRKAA